MKMEMKYDARVTWGPNNPKLYPWVQLVPANEVGVAWYGAPTEFVGAFDEYNDALAAATDYAATANAEDS